MKFIQFVFAILLFISFFSHVNICPAACNITYENGEGTAGAGVGDSEDRNTYRGIYWTGPSKTICAVDVQLYVKGDISEINYLVTVWDVDIENDLSLSTLLASSMVVSGADIVAGWNRFGFTYDVTLAAGKTVVLISREDAGVKDGVNRIQVLNGYDENDTESSQWNIHYGSNMEMAGRRPGDEDQPEYFTCNFRLLGVDTTLDSAQEYPNIPEDIQVTAIGTGRLKIEWQERGTSTVVVDHYNIYSYNETTAETVLVGSSLGTSFVHAGLSKDSVHTYIVTAVSAAGNESYHSLDNHDNWRATVVGNAFIPAPMLLMLGDVK